MPLVSIIMNCHNCGQYLSQALESVYQQIFKDYEIIFWDNKSTDNSSKIALSYGAPLRYFRGEEFLPLGAARNLAIKEAQGKYVAFLDCDDIWLPEKLEIQCKLLESNEKLGLVYSDSYMIDSNGNLRNGTCFETLRPFRGNALNKLLLNNFIPLLTVVVRKQVLNKEGIFNPKYEMAEEYDLWLKIARSYSIDYVEQPLAKYRIHNESSTQRNVALLYPEILQIIDYWLKEKPELKRELGREIKRRKVLINRAMVISAIMLVYKHKNMKSIKEFGELIGNLLLSRH
ncbi:glycosyltransferase family 2 protein [Chloroflexota bacterium]